MSNYGLPRQSDVEAARLLLEIEAELGLPADSAVKRLAESRWEERRSPDALNTESPATAAPGEDRGPKHHAGVSHTWLGSMTLWKVTRAGYDPLWSLTHDGPDAPRDDASLPIREVYAYGSDVAAVARQLTSVRNLGEDYDTPEDGSTFLDKISDEWEGNFRHTKVLCEIAVLQGGLYIDMDAVETQEAVFPFYASEAAPASVAMYKKLSRPGRRWLASQTSKDGTTPRGAFWTSPLNPEWRDWVLWGGEHSPFSSPVVVARTVPIDSTVMRQALELTRS